MEREGGRREGSTILMIKTHARRALVTKRFA